MKKKTGIISCLEILGRSSAAPQRGDIFVFKPKRKDFYYGRVIDEHVVMKPWVGALVYLYEAHSSNKETIPALNKLKLLIPPEIFDFGCWTKGYVETIAKKPLDKEDILPVHCFFDVVSEGYVDERGAPLDARTEPCGVYGLTPYSGFNRQIRKALNLAVSSEE